MTFFGILAAVAVLVAGRTVVQTWYVHGLSNRQWLLVSVPPLLSAAAFVWLFIVLSQGQAPFAVAQEEQTFATLFRILGTVIGLLGVYLLAFSGPFTAAQRTILDSRRGKASRLWQMLAEYDKPSARKLRFMGILMIIAGLYGITLAR